MINKQIVIDALNQNDSITIEFASLTSEKIHNIVCSHPSVLGRQNTDSNKLVVWRHDLGEYDDIEWNSIKSWSI